MVICFLIHTVFWICGRISCQLLDVHGVNDVRQTEMYTAKPLVPEPSSFKDETAIETEKFKSLAVYQITSELI